MCGMRMSEWEWKEIVKQLKIAETFCRGINKSFRSLGVCFVYVSLFVCPGIETVSQWSIIPNCSSPHLPHTVSRDSFMHIWGNVKLWAVLFFQCVHAISWNTWPCNCLWSGQYRHRICVKLSYFHSFAVFSTTAAAVAQLSSLNSLTASNKCVVWMRFKTDVQKMSSRL